MLVAGFDWDAGNRAKCQKHGVSRAAIESIFRRPIAVLPDPLHSKSEERWWRSARAMKAAGFFVVFTFRSRRGKRLIRPDRRTIHMHKQEMDHYEKETARFQKR